PLPEGAVPHLVVVLEAVREAGRGDPLRRSPAPLGCLSRRQTLEEPSPPQRFHDIPDGAGVRGKVPLAVARYESADLMMKVVGPDAVQAISPLIRRKQQSALIPLVRSEE